MESDDVTDLGLQVGVSGHNFPELRKSIMGCVAFVMVITKSDDQKFLQRMLQVAGEAGKPVVTAPYHVADQSEGGMVRVLF